MNFVSNEVDNIFIFIVSVSGLLLLLVTGVMIYFVIRYRSKKNPKADNITGNTTLEVVWTVVPLILVLAMFFYGWQGFKYIRGVPPDAMVIKVTGRMWNWSFEYDNKKKTDTLLYVPVGKPIKMEIYSSDVNHSFYLPAFRVKEDAVPGRTNYLWFMPTKAGTYDIMCAEYCGLNHSYMLGKLIVMPEYEFYEWYNKVPDTVKVQDTSKTGMMPADSLRNVKSAPDTLKTPGSNLKDTIITGPKKIKKDTIKNK